MVWLQYLSHSRCSCAYFRWGVPPSNEAMQRGEGVALILLGDAISGWEAGGKQWKSWSARMVSACFKIGEKQHDFLYVVSCYAHTWSSVRERSFSWSNDLKQHKSLAERSLPIELQYGAIQCSLCHRRLRSRGGLTVCKCQPAE